MSRIRSQINYYDLTGGLNNVSTPDTLNSTPKKTETPDIVNIEFFKLGGIKSMEGNTAFGDQLDSAVVGGWEYSRGDKKYMIIATYSGCLYMYNEGTDKFDFDAVDSSTNKNYFYKFPHPSSRVSFCNMNNGVVATNGVDDPVFYDIGRETLLTGTVSATDESTTITGSSTTFGVDVVVGDYITIEGCSGTYKVTEITDEDEMTVTPAIATTPTHYYNFFNSSNNYYTLSATPSIGDNVYDDDEQIISTVDYFQAGTDGEGSIVFKIDGNDILGTRQHVPSGTSSFNRDKEVAVASVSGARYYLTHLSECNAVLINTDEERPDNWVDKTIRGSAIQFYAGRLWIGGSDGLYYSGLGSYNKWDVYENNAGEIAEVYNDTSEIKALGLYSDYMLIHKEFNTYLLTMTGDSSTISVKPYSNVSCDSQQSWIVSNTKYFVYSRENMDIFPLTQRTIYSDRYLGDAISNKVRNVFQNLRDADLEKIFCVSLPRKRWMLFYMPMVDQLGSSYALIYDFQCKAFIVRKVPQEVTIAFNYMNEVYIGTQDGLVLKEFTGTSFNGEPIVSYYKSPWFDWAGDYFHSFSEFAIDMAGEYNNNFYIRTFKDGDSPYEDRVLDDSALINTGLIWDGGEDEYPYYIYIYTTPVTEDGVTTYQYVCRIPDTNPEATQDTTHTIDEDVYITLHKVDDNLQINTYTIQSKEIVEEEYLTIDNYYANYDEDGHIETNDTEWDKDVWTSGSFNSIRMLLPNNVFETFQLEIGTTELGQGFAIYGYNFRRIETEEAPW